MSPEEIWLGDLFDRRAEAEQVIGFLENVTMRPSLREDGHAYVMAVDAPYGEGKSYFLRRFARHMAQTHPVAFVDAWTDDLEDEPLVALAATLDEALSSLADKSGELRKKRKAFTSKATAVAKIVGVGLTKRAASLLIMESGAEAAHAVISSPSEITKDLGKDVLKDAANEAIDNAISAATTIVSGDMEKRIERFREGRKAIEDMKAALADIVEHLSQDCVYPPPIVIVIDELDRCRPTYAIKLLEEIKHIFDVQGVAFVLGTHGSALAHSVSAAYGSQFDGKAYLRRFFSRTYRLREVELSPLVRWLCQQRNIDVRRLRAPPIRIAGRLNQRSDPEQMIALYMKLYSFNARDAFAVVDALEVCLALTSPGILYLPYLMPWLLAYLRGETRLLTSEVGADWSMVERDQWGNAVGDLDPLNFISELGTYARQTDNELLKAVNVDKPNLAAQVIAGLTHGSENQPTEFAKPRSYPQLLSAVGRFLDDD